MPSDLIKIFKLVWVDNLMVNCVPCMGENSIRLIYITKWCQAGVNYPSLFNVYINGLIEELSSMYVGCHIDEMSRNNISYAADMMLLSASIYGMQRLFKTCKMQANNHDIKYNVLKSQYTVFRSGCKL